MLRVFLAYLPESDIIKCYFRFLRKRDLRDVWPNLELFMHGGISFDPYRKEYSRIIPHTDMNYMENYNASEGYFAFQDSPKDSSMLLMTNGGIFFE